jgi:hypothetical protein
MLKTALIIFLFAFSLAAASPAKPSQQQERLLADFHLNEALPQEIASWNAVPEDQAYGRDDIFDYMDGAGEIYLAFDFRFVFVRQYAKPDAPSIVVEIYQMSSAPDAFGVFTQDTDGDEIDLGQGAIYAAGLLRFWKDTVFVRILADTETPESKSAVMKLGEAIVSAIPQTGEKPGLIRFLPSDGLRPKSLRYFHTKISLDTHFYLANANILRLTRDTQVAAAAYETKDGRARLILVQYPSPDQAAEANFQFAELYMLERYNPDAVIEPKKLEDGKFAGVWRRDRYIAAVVEADKKSVLERLVREVSKNLEGKD